MSNILKPEDYLGFKPGTDRKLADWSQIVEYFMKISQLSDRVKVDIIGNSTQENSFQFGYFQIHLPRGIGKNNEGRLLILHYQNKINRILICQ